MAAVAKQVVGPSGLVIGVDMTPEMLAVAERYREQIGERLGFHNVEFRRGRIQDLCMNLDAAEQYLQRHPIASVADLQAFSPFQTEQCTQQPLVEGVEFCSVTVAAYKGKQGPCWDCNHAVIYKGPWSEVKDDDGHTLVRGVPMAVCEKTFRLYTQEPYARDILPVPPLTPVALEDAQPFDCSRDAMRSPRETKGLEYRATTDAAACCEPGKCC